MASGLRALLAQQRPLSENGGDSSSDDGKTCPACPAARKSKKTYCEVHNSAFESLQRHACKPSRGMEDKVRSRVSESLWVSESEGSGCCPGLGLPRDTSPILDVLAPGLGWPPVRARL